MENHPDRWPDPSADEGAWPRLCQQAAAAADLCLRPFTHAAVAQPELPSSPGGSTGLSDCGLRLLARRADGERSPADDIELEIYRSGDDLHLMLSWPELPERPLLWQGNHPVWMDGDSGLRCDRPDTGAQLEALARRLRALLVGG